MRRKDKLINKKIKLNFQSYLLNLIFSSIFKKNLSSKVLYKIIIGCAIKFKRQIASLTKMMTAISTIKICSKYRISPK